MKRIAIGILGLLLSVTLMAQERKKVVDIDMVDGFRSNAKSVFDTRLQEQDMLALALNKELVEQYDTVCTYRVRTAGMTDQKKSGRCWYFSTMNILRSELIRKYNLENFEFSQTYGQFWDLLEKSNRFLENVIEYRKQPIDSRMNEWLFKKPIGDGGHFANAAHLISKYGAVPLEVMPEKHSSSDNFRLMTLVRTVLRRYGLLLREAEKTELQSIKEAALSDIYKVLVANLGEPPVEFEWTLKDKDGKLISKKNYTPASFRDEFIAHDMENDYVIFMDDPTKDYYKMYRVDNSRNCYEYSDWTFLNVPAEELAAMGLESLKNGDMFYFSADTDASAMMMEGIYDVGLYDIGKKLDISLDMDKEEMIRSCEIKSLHAMAMAGVKLDESGKPEKWLIENSFGEVRGWDGYVVMQHEWLMTYLFRFAIERKYVPERYIQMLDMRPLLLKSWNPVY